MSLLFCTWDNERTQDVEEKPSEEEEEKNENNFKFNGILNHKISEDFHKEEIKEDIPVNGDHRNNEDVKQKPSMFIMWKDPGLDYESEKEEEEEEEETTKTNGPEEEKQNLVAATNGIDERGAEVENKTKEENSEEIKKDIPPKPLFFAVWKDPNKEDEYVSDSSSEYLSDDDEEENDSPAPECNEAQAEGSENNKVEELQSDENKDNLFDSLLGETKGSDDLLNSIAQSVSNQMTTIFCDEEDFDLKRFDDSDGTEDRDSLLESALPSNGLRSRSRSRSRSDSIHSVTRSVKSNSSDRSHSFSLRPKKEKNYDIFSKPKKVSKYFDPGTFIDKTLYKTHRCDVKIKKYKLQSQDLESLPPARKKRKVVETEEDLPLSKRKKMRALELKNVPKPRSLSSIMKREERQEPLEEKYQAVCKFVKAQCPLCWNFWQVSQPYGQHVLRQTCQKTDGQRVQLNPGGEKGKFVTVHPSTNKTDSCVSSSSVPSLRLLSRGGLEAGNSTSQVVMSVKEGLEYYHSLVLPGNGTNLFNYISCMGKITLVSSFKQFERLCRDPLKVAIYLEKKISRCRARLNPGHLLTRNWVEKYQHFLRLPLHDIFLSVRPEAGFRVLEVPDTERLRLICLVCSSLACSGCSSTERPKQLESRNNKREQTRKQRKKVKPKVKNKNIKGGKDSKSKWKQSGIKLQLHVCKKCKKYFKTVAALKSHVKYCR